MNAPDMPARSWSKWPRLFAVALAVLAVATALPAVAGGSGDFQLRWREHVYAWRYNPEHKPAWLSDEEALALVRAAADAWSECGVSLRYEGLTDKVPGAMDNENVIGWGM